MKFSTSINIKRDENETIDYVVTANSRQVMANLIDSYNSGLHSFCLIGSYGTGKSSFILALENCMNNQSKGEDCLFRNKGQFAGFTKFKFLNIVGEYRPFLDILKDSIDDRTLGEKNFFNSLNSLYQNADNHEQFLVIVVDEFGKVLEHAAKNNPEKEMYFLQQFCEYVNDSAKNILFITTLHQGFNAYAKGLDTEQKQEWNKVKGRIIDIVFKEPIEQLLNLTAMRISEKCERNASESTNELYDLAIESKFTTSALNREVVKSLYPLDIFSAYILTQANQRYGQNERTLITFLEAKGDNSISNYIVKDNVLYNLAKVHDYISYSFNSYLSEANTDSNSWSAIKVAIERIEGTDVFYEEVENAINIVKVIGMLNIFASSSAIIDTNFLCQYARLAMGIDDASAIIKKLDNLKIIRFAKYKSKYILYEGTDVDIEQGLLEASIECKKSEDFIQKLIQSFDFRIILANAHYYKTGTPRYFEYRISNEPLLSVAYGEIDGYINLIFAHETEIEKTKQICMSNKGVAIAYCVFLNSDAIINRLYEIDKLEWVKNIYVKDDNDKVAHREIDNLIAHEKNILTNVVLESLYSDNVNWIFNGEYVDVIKGQKELSKYVSTISDTIFCKTPIFKFELVNKFKISSTVSSARQAYLMHLIENSEDELLGFDSEKFPPEKSLFLTMLKQTGIHKEGTPFYELGEPDKSESFMLLWNECEIFLKSATQKQRKLIDLYDILKSAPYGMKPGFIDCWIPSFLIIKKDDYALYQDDAYIPAINKEVLELLLRSPKHFTIKSFSVDGIKQQFFNKYREAINQQETQLKTDSFIETIKPFLTFYKRLNNYAKKTKAVSNIAQKFRDIISNATDPEETFFEKLPDALGFKQIVIEQDPQAINSFVDVLQDAIRSLRGCYDDFLKIVENHLLKCIGIKEVDFQVYKSIVDERYKSVKLDFLPLDLKNFYSRLVGRFAEKNTWIESVGSVILKRPLESINDSEKKFLLTSIEEKIFQLDEYVEMHKSDNESIVRLHITQNNGSPIIKQVVLSKEKTKEVDQLEKKLEEFLSDSKDDSVTMAALIQLIKRRNK